MQKFFRKYNKQIMAVVASLMMIVFIGGTALDALLQPQVGDRPVGEAFGEPVSQFDQIQVDTHTRILSRLALPWNVPWQFDFTLEPLNPLDYMLLAREARRNGLKPDLDRSREFLRRRAPRNLTDLRLALRVSMEDVEQAVANMLMVEDSWRVAQSSICLSQLDIDRAIKRRHEKLNASVLALRADAFLDEAEAFDEATVRSQFDKYKEQLPGDEPMSFGYMIPNRVRVEYIKLATDEIPPRRQITRKMAETYWQENKEDFPKPVDDTDTEEEVEDAEDEDDSPFYESLDEVQDEVFAALRRKQQLQTGRQMAEILRQRLADDWFGEEIAEDGYLSRPEGVDAAGYYQGIVDSLAAGLEYPQCISVGTTEYLSSDTAADQPEIGGSREDIAGVALGGRPFGGGIERVQGIEERSTEFPAGPGGPLAQFQTASKLMIDADNNLYIYRVIDVSEAHAPEEIDAVREQVVEDLRLQLAFDRAAEQAEAVRQTIGEDGLIAAWDAFEDMTAEQKDEAGGAFEASPFARTTGTASPVVVRDKGAREENTIFSEDFVSRVYDILDRDGPEAIAVIEVPSLEKAFVVQLSGVKHMSPSDYEQRRTTVRFQLVQQRLQQLRHDWFTSEKIRARCEFNSL